MGRVFRGRMGNFAEGFFIGCWKFFELFSKLKTTFCKCKASIKTKINMNYVSKEYEIKIKMVNYKMATAKTDVFIGL